MRSSQALLGKNCAPPGPAGVRRQTCSRRASGKQPAPMLQHSSLPAQRARSLIRQASPRESTELGSALESLDALLPSDSEAQQQPAAQQRRARNATRRTSMGGEEWSGRTVLDVFIRGGGMRLAVGQRSEVGATQAQLPAAEPLCAYALAAWAAVATAGTSLLPSLFPAEGTVMYSDLAARGEALHTFATANFVCPTWASLATGAGLLATAGAAEERVLGRARFAAIYLLAGATGTVWYYALSSPEDPAAYQCGTTAGLVGVSAAMAVACWKNKALLTGGQLGRMAGAAVAAAAGAIASDVLLWPDHTLLPGCYVAAAVAGVALGAACSPRYSVLREVIIPDGSVEVPDDAPEMEVVVDRTTGLQQWGACLGYGMVLAAFAAAITDLPAEALALGGGAGGEGGGQMVDLLLRHLLRGGPEAARELYDAAPEAWPLKA